MRKPTYLSPSSLNVFRECPRCFVLQVKQRIARPRGPMPSITIGLDSVVKKHFDRCRAKKELPSFLAVDGKPLPAKLATDFKDKLYLDASAILPDIGLQPRVFVLMGVLDECLRMNNGTYAPLDHKTRASPPPDVHPAYRLQMDTYCLLLDGNRMPTGGKAYLVYYYPVDAGEMETSIGFGFAVKEVATDPERSRAVVRDAVAALLSPELPASDPRCEYCGFLKAAGPYSIFEPTLGAEEESPPPAEREKPAAESEEGGFKDGALF